MGQGRGGSAPRVVLGCDFFLKYTVGLARGLTELGCDVTLLTRDHDWEFGGEPGAMRAHVEGVLGDRVCHEQIHGRFREVGTWRSALAERRARHRVPPDVVHVQDSVRNDARIPLAAGARPDRFALTLHDVHPHPGDPPNPRHHHAVAHTIIKLAAVTFVHADVLRDELIEKHRPRGGVVVVPHGVDPPDPQPLPERPGILFFGRVSHYKGLDVLLDAMPQVWRALPEVRLTVAGEGELPAHAVLADERVHVRNDHVPERDLNGLFGQATVVAMPYREASQSGVGSTAKRFGRATVVSEVGGLPELAADGSGRLVPPEDPAALAAGLVDVISTPGLAERMGRAGGATIEAESGWHRIAELTLAAYERYVIPRTRG